ncbi:hypothetical protein [Novosphingobium sp. ST904]|nr:hypothetical protein [Novosphingobium sp. ST904]
MKGYSECLEIYVTAGVAIVDRVIALHKAGKLENDDAARIIAEVVHAEGRCKAIMEGLLQ